MRGNAEMAEDADGDILENRSGHLTAVAEISLGFGDDDDHGKCRVFGGHESDKRGPVPG